MIDAFVRKGSLEDEFDKFRALFDVHPMSRERCLNAAQMCRNFQLWKRDPDVVEKVNQFCYRVLRAKVCCGLTAWIWKPNYIGRIEQILRLDVGECDDDDCCYCVFHTFLDKDVDN
jgi:hypothetical protein